MNHERKITNHGPTASPPPAPHHHPTGPAQAPRHETSRLRPETPVPRTVTGTKAREPPTRKKMSPERTTERNVTVMKLLSVNIGRPRPNPWKGLSLTGIDKRPVDGPVTVTAPGPKGTGAVGLTGDRVHDVKHHGGRSEPSRPTHTPRGPRQMEEPNCQATPQLFFGVEPHDPGPGRPNDALIGERLRIGADVVLGSHARPLP
ncbi:hypothetical protein GCM10018952_57440 [Streptosporangium vulgare]